MTSWMQTLVWWCFPVNIFNVSFHCHVTSIVCCLLSFYPIADNLLFFLLALIFFLVFFAFTIMYLTVDLFLLMVFCSYWTHIFNLKSYIFHYFEKKFSATNSLHIAFLCPFLLGGGGHYISWNSSFYLFCLFITFKYFVSLWFQSFLLCSFLRSIFQFAHSLSYF